MHVTLRQLEVFEAVVRLRSFTKASKELHLSQPGVSTQVRQLEAAVGQTLLEQRGRSFELTDAGVVIERLSHQIAEHLREAEDSLHELAGGRGGRLRIAVVSTVNYFASRLLSRYCVDFPTVKVSLEVNNRQTVIQALREGTTDIVLMGRPPPALDVESVAFMDNPLVVIAGPRHHLATRTGITLAELAEQTVLIREPGSGTRTAMQRFFSDHEIEPASAIEMNSNEAIKQAVEAGLGVGVVSMHTVGLELDAERLVVLDIERFPIVRRWYVVHRRGKRLSGAAQAFKALVIEQARGERAKMSEQIANMRAAGARDESSRTTTRDSRVKPRSRRASRAAPKR